MNLLDCKIISPAFLDYIESKINPIGNILKINQTPLMKVVPPTIISYHFWSADMSFLTNNIMDYYFVAQGKTTIPGVDDAEELTLTDVRPIT